jgi:hypothetical protein
MRTNITQISICEVLLGKNQLCEAGLTQDRRKLARVAAAMRIPPVDRQRALLPEYPLKDLSHIPQLPLNRKCLLNLLGRNARGNLGIVHHQFAEIQIVFPGALFLKPRSEARGPLSSSWFWGT